MKILVIDGPNINMPGIREWEISVGRDYAALCPLIKDNADELSAD